MSLVYWTADLSTGFDDIDEQHKMLLQYINELYDAKQNGDVVEIERCFENLINYTIEHFSYEEMMLQEAGYRLLEQHKKVHANFVDKMTMFQDRYHNGDKAALDELLKLLEDWLFRHIRLNDHGYVASVKASGIRD